MKMYGGVDVYIHVFLTLVPTGQEAGWAPELVWMTCRRAKSCPYQNSDPSACQPADSHYTNSAILAPLIYTV
jgi:hypothetical protein